MKVSEFLKLDDKELSDKLVELKRDLFFLRMQHTMNQLDNPTKITLTKRDIARVKTVIRQKELGIAGGAGK
ncbi:MAG: 50S ribosomal protein L29 [Oscillospiraceae bacterium]|jgi:large subunit ribosomal protein L29|nr:50S ribosomal protein L29 [Oscillospiraceae bacterium]